jgi:hypothetical protein
MEERAMEERAVEERAVDVTSIGVDPLFNSLREDARFGALLRRMNLTRSAREAKPGEVPPMAMRQDR